MISDICKGVKGTKDQAILINNFLYHYFSSPHNAIVQDKDIYSDLIRGVAWCDQRAWALATFMGKLGTEARMVFTKNKEGISTHTVSEVLIDNKWSLFDPQFGFFAYNAQGEIASYDDICRSPSLFLSSRNMSKLRRIDTARFLKTKESFISNIYYENYPEPLLWKSPVLSRNFSRKIVSTIIDMYVHFLGQRFVNVYQDVFFKFYLSQNNSAQLYARAKNYELFSRLTLAISEYEKVIKNFPESLEAQDSRYFLGILYSKAGKANLSIQALKHLLNRFPDTQWQAPVYYYLGCNYELLGDYSYAIDYYKKALNLYKESNPDSLVSDELKVIERISGLLK